MMWTTSVYTTSGLALYDVEIQKYFPSNVPCYNMMYRVTFDMIIIICGAVYIIKYSVTSSQ